MASQTLLDFVDGVGKKPYRTLVEEHLRTKSSKELLEALGLQLELLPPDARMHIMRFLELARTKLGNDPSFWSSASCREAADLIAGIVGEALPTDDFIETFASAIRDGKVDPSLVFFEMATLNFASLAAYQVEWRKVMGIRKGLFR